MSYNTFISCKPVDQNNKQNRNYVWHFYFKTDPLISHNIIENMTYFDYYHHITLNNNYIILVNNTFQNLNLNCPRGGGGFAGWIVPYKRYIEYTIIFKDCKFYNNKVFTKGGAVQHGNAGSSANCILTFDGCEFISNNANKEGGAIAIETKNDIFIKSCYFESNNGSNGGAIFIGPFSDSENYTSSIIDSCIFENNIAISGHAIYICDKVLFTDIINNTFTNYGDYGNHVICSASPQINISKCKFKNIDCGAIYIFALIDAYLENLEFENCSSSQGGAISLDLLENAKSFYIIDRCKFINCGAIRDGGSIYVLSFVDSVLINNSVFDGGYTNEGEGVAIYTSNNVENINIGSNISFINQNCNDKYLISSSSNNFEINDIRIDNAQFGSGFKSIQLNNGIASIKNLFFNQCTSGIEINSDCKDATIQNCIFSDCYSQNHGQVVKISNQKCTFIKNIINFTLNAKAIAALVIQ